MLSRLPGFWLLSALLWLTLPCASQAWTEAHVRAAHATLDLSARGDLEVLLDLTLEVRGGWLERLELPGLDEGLVLADSEPALAVLESGERVPAQVSLRASTLTLMFARRDGLRRGLHHLLVRYTKERATPRDLTGSASARSYWTLPGFEAGLGQASIELRGPLGMTAVSNPELAQDVETREEGGRRVLRFSRLHVPRASPWTVAVDMPNVPGVGPKLDERAQQQELRAGWLGTGLLAVAGLLLILAMRMQVERTLAREGLAARGLLLARPLSLPWLALLSALAAASFSSAAPVSAACWSLMFILGVPQARVRRAPLPLGTFRALARNERMRLERERMLSWLGVPWADLCSLLGALGASSLLLGVTWWRGVGALGREPWSLLSLCALLGFLASARSLRPRSLSEQVAILTRAAGRARAVGCAFALLAYESPGRLSQPRLRILPSARYPGLLRLEIMVDTRRSMRPLVLSVLVEADSAAERWLRARWPLALREGGEGGRRVALIRHVEDVGQAVEALLEHLSVESQRALVEACGSAPERAA